MPVLFLKNITLHLYLVEVLGVDHERRNKRRGGSHSAEIRRRTRKKYSAEEKVRIVLEGLRGESTVAELCRREGTHQNMYSKWSKELLEAGKQRLVGDTRREADSQEVEAMRRTLCSWLWPPPD